VARYPHSFKIYKKWTHVLIVFCIIILPIAFILLAGSISQISTNALIAGLGLSAFRLLIAYAISLFLAILLAVTLGHGKLGDFFVPVFDIFQNLPSFALIPVFVILFGYTNKMAILFIASSVLWPILFSILSALRTAKTDYNEAATIFGATGFKRIWHYLIPLSFPAIITGSIVGISIGWEAVIGIEIIGLSNGIGSFLSFAAQFDKQLLMLGIITLLLLVFSINRLVWMPLLKRSQLYAE
jgi:ABC-type nitrate/sulfonate/bicarbonate transport system permease component